jgi:transposase
MFIDWNTVRIFVKPGSTDLRKQINGLAVLVSEGMGKDPLSGSLFLFTNKQRRLLKILYWDRTGFCLWQKRLEKDRYPWPRSVQGKEEETEREITADQIRMLLAGIDFWHAHETLHFSSVS